MRIPYTKKQPPVASSLAVFLLGLIAVTPCAFAEDDLRKAVEQTLGASYPIFASRAGASFKMGSPEEKAALTASVEGVMKLLPADCTPEKFRLTICGLGNTHMGSDAMLPTLRALEAIIFVPYTPERPIRRGDVVFFEIPVDAPTPPRFIFRIIGLPGETVELINGVVNINGATLKLDPADEQLTGSAGGEPIDLFRETTPEGESYMIGQIASGPTFEEAGTTGPYQVPAGQYFLLGDNRHNAADSRYAFIGGSTKFVALDRIVGRVAMIYVSADAKRTGMMVDAK